MDELDLVDRWVELDQQIKKLVREQEAVAKALGSQTPGTELEGRSKRLRVKDRAVLKPELLEQRLTPSLWRKITKRVPVADLLKAEIRRGKIDQDTVNECSTRSKVWFEAIM
jgi:hypothetical protein